MKKLVVIIALLFSTPCWANEKINLELAHDRVDITTGFNGASIVAFGTVNRSDDVSMVITLKGPEIKTVVRQKEQGITGVWSNGESVEFRRVPSYYDYAVFTGKQTLPDNVTAFGDTKIDVEDLEFYSENDIDEIKLEPFRDALIRGMRSKDFYPIKPGDINFYGDNLFKSTFLLPPGVPTGSYTVEATVFQNGQVQDKQTKSLIVGQVGFNARVYIYATQHSFVYGFLSVLLAVILGWSAFTFLRRD